MITTATHMRTPGEEHAALRGLAWRRWPVWSVGEPARSCVVAVPAVAIAAIVAMSVVTPFHLREFAVFGGLLFCGAAAIEATRTLPDPQGTVARDLQSVWYLAIAVVLLPWFAFVAPIPLTVYRLLRSRRMIVYRRVYSNATLSLAYGGASLGFHALPDTLAGTRPGVGVHVLTWVGAVVLCGLCGWLINSLLVILALRLSDRSATVRELIGSKETITFDLLELSLAVSLTLVVAINPLLMTLALPSVVLCRRYLMQSQLVAHNRIDAKTGLLNAGTWQREATAELLRAVRARTKLALVMVDIDHFGSVNDTAGYLAGDQVLRGIAATLREHLSGSALIGRFGGEEFAILMPHTGLEEARRISERIRDQVAGQPIAIEDGTHAGFVFRLTVSIGIAVLDHSRQALAELIGAADMALSQAKSTGRNRVCVIPGTVEEC